MAILVKAPELPFTGGTVTWWEKEPGEEAQFGDVLVEIRSGGTDYPVKAYLPGTVLHVFAKAGTTVQPDAPLALLGDRGEDIREWLTLAPADAPPPAPAGSGFTAAPAGSGFAVPTAQPVPAGGPPAVENPFSVAETSLPPALPDAGSGSSFTVAPGGGAAVSLATDHLTTEQVQNLALYGRGFEKFVKMRPVPQQGAMGELFFATQSSSGRDVVIKRLRADRRADAKSREYFMREINLGTALPYHKNIVTILYSDENDIGPYYVMERINGHSLQHLLDTDQLPPERFRDILLGILEGLRHVHAHWMVHRDLKPMNILVDTQLWMPKIIDFGLARHPSYPDIDVADMGTPGYMAPEQRGDQQDVTARADVYAMGCVLYAMCTRTAPQPLELARITDPTYAAVIARCTQPDPADRYASVTALVEALLAKPPAAAIQPKPEMPVPAAPPAPENTPLEAFKAYLNEWALDALPANQPLTRLTLKLLQRQAEAAGVDAQSLETELNDFLELYREIKEGGAVTPFRKRSLLLQGALTYITENTVDQLLAPEKRTAPALAPPQASFPDAPPPIKNEDIPLERQSLRHDSVGETRHTPPLPASAPANDIPFTGTGLLYARSAGLFEEFETDKLTSELQPDSLYEIQPVDARHATFVIAANPAAQQEALQNKRFYLQPACVLAEVEPTQHQRISTLQPGRLERQGSQWKIVEKAKIRIG